MNNISKKILIITAILAVVFTYNLRNVYALSLSTIKALIQKTSERTYQQIPRTNDYEVHVYETPTKETGYTIIQYYPDKTIYTGYGVEGSWRTYTINITATST